MIIPNSTSSSSSTSSLPRGSLPSGEFPFFSQPATTAQQNTPSRASTATVSESPVGGTVEVFPSPRPHRSSRRRQSQASSSLHNLQLSARRWRVYDKAVAMIRKCFPEFDLTELTSLHSSPEQETHPAFLTHVSCVLIVESAADLGLQCRRDLVKGDARPRQHGEEFT
eukprot:GHVS01049204.1.p1 GENE.GHVS01049204.1~~GHVS01049204.1.p1  ORF type:complete len:168 (-),score=37.26 GHVS01049204.1:64-567(-)